MGKTVGLAAVLVGFAIGLAVPINEARAQDYPYCAIKGGRGSYENCGYANLQQCRAAVSGVGGFCQPNPRFAQRPYFDDPREPPRRYRDRRGY